MDPEKLKKEIAKEMLLKSKYRVVLLTICFLLLLLLMWQFNVVERKLQALRDEKDENSVYQKKGKVEFVESAQLGKCKGHSDGSDHADGTDHLLDLLETNQHLGVPLVMLNSDPPYIPKQRIVHFDLKGAPPVIKYLKHVIALAKNAGATGILIEYEDMFPFTGNLSAVSAGNVYTLEEIKDVLGYARTLNLDVIPLVQTFGHMEFALKHQKFSNIREIPGSPQSLCPSRNRSLDLIRELVSQVLKVHPNIKYLHIGCDEVFEMGECELCRTEIRENLFLKHVQNVANIVHEHNPDVQVLIWDDMLRHISLSTLQTFNIGDYVEPMVWVYAEDIYRFVQPTIWDKYSTVFKAAWAASAFKGAFGETLYIPNARRHLENNLRWLDVMANQGKTFKAGFRGIVLTGWQRYDHFAVLCELLPAALPSLLLNLLATSNGYFDASLKETFLSVLSCPIKQNERRPSPFLNLENDPNMLEKLSRCLFPGNEFFKMMYRLHALELEAREYLDVTTRQRGWLTAYNAKHNYSLPLRVDELTQELPRVYHGLISLAKSTVEGLTGIMDNYTISEWVEQRIYPYLMELEKVQNQSSVLKSVDRWPARPLPILKDLKRHGIFIG